MSSEGYQVYWPPENTVKKEIDEEIPRERAVIAKLLNNERDIEK